MRFKLVAKVLLTGLLCLLPLSASALNPRPICQVCRHYIDKSPQACSAVLMLGGKQPKQIPACSLFCLFEQLEHYRAAPEVIIVTNYITLGEEFVQQLNAEQAVYLFDAEGDPERSHEPYIYAFACDADAKTAQADVGGELLAWDAVKERCIKLAADWEPDQAAEEEPEIPHRAHQNQ